MIEDEAKTKWCPMVRYSSDNNSGTGNNRGRIDADQYNAFCIGSACMMFRKSTVVDENMVPERITDEYGELIGLKYMKKDLCWCGLACKP